MPIEALDPSERIALERRLAHLETTMQAHSEAYKVLMDHHQERMEDRISDLDRKLDRVIAKMEKPVNWGALIGGVSMAIGIIGWLVNVSIIEPQAAHITALERRVQVLETQVPQTNTGGSN